MCDKSLLRREPDSKKVRVKFFLLVCLFASNANAEIKVAFFRCYTPSLKAVQLTPGGKFCHVAISHNGGWLHAHPVDGVKWKKNLPEITGGRCENILIDISAPAVPHEEVTPWIGKPYDASFRWETKEATYCSKLVGCLLKVPPTLMTFKSPFWNGFKDLPVNEVGISPDEIYHELLRRNYQEDDDSSQSLGQG